MEFAFLHVLYANEEVIRLFSTCLKRLGSIFDYDHSATLETNEAMDTII